MFLRKSVRCNSHSLGSAASDRDRRVRSTQGAGISAGAGRGGQTTCTRLGCDLGASFGYRPGEGFGRLLTAWQGSGIIEA